MEFSKVILINKPGTTASMISSHFKELSNINFIHKHSIEEAICTLKLLDKIDLIICNSNMTNPETAQELQSIIDEAHATLFLLGSNTFFDSQTYIEADSSDWESIIQKAIGLLANSSASSDIFVPFPINYFELFEKAPCDIYLCVHKSKEPDQYLKRIHRDDPMEKEYLNRYKNLKFSLLYIKIEDQQNFLTNFTNILKQKLIDSTHRPPEETHACIKESFQLIANLIQKIGMQNISSDFVDKMISGIHKSLANSPLQKLENLSLALMQKDDRYFNQVFLTSMIGCNILNRIEWGTAEHEKKIAQAAFFADIYLELPEWSHIKNKKDFEQFDLNEKEKINILGHAKFAFTDIQNFEKLLPDVDKMVLHHHGSSNGIGFPESWHRNLSKLSLVFNIAYQFANYLIIENNTDPNIHYPTILEKFEESCATQEGTEKILQSLRQTFIEKLQAS